MDGIKRRKRFEPSENKDNEIWIRQPASPASPSLGGPNRGESEIAMAKEGYFSNEIISGKEQPEEELRRLGESQINFNADKAPSNWSGKKSFFSVLKKILLWLAVILFFSLILLTFYFSWKIHSVGKKITIYNENPSFGNSIKSLVNPIISREHKKLRGEDRGRINILLLGAAGAGKPGKNLTDTVMIASINTQSKKVALLSLPRDLYVKVPQSQNYLKINSLYQLGLESGESEKYIREAVEKITDLQIDYLLALDFDGFQKIVDDLDGINIQVERDIYDTRYPGPNYSYETFELKKGFHKLDGKTALKYVRERHNDPEGDFGRAKRQQKVIQAAKNKALSLKTILNIFTLNKLLDDLGNNIRTDISIDEIGGLVALSKEVDSQNITNVVVDAWKKDSLLKVSHVFFGEVRAFILVPRTGNWNELQELANNIFDLESIRRKQAAIEKESPSVTLINQSGDRNLPLKIKKLLEEKMKFRTVIIRTAENADGSSETKVEDKTAGTKMFSLNEIVRNIPARLENENDGIINVSDNSDFIVTLGRDIIEAYQYEEDSVEDFNQAQENEF